MVHHLTWRSALSAVALLLAVGACTDGGAPEADGEATLTLQVGALDLPGVVDACYALTVTNGPTRTGEVVWTRSGICASGFGSGGAVSYVGPCDASVGVDNSVNLVLERVLVDADGDPGTPPTALEAPDDYVNPCPAPTGCTRNVTCEENRDAALTFDLTIARSAQQGFFDVAVELDDVFCSAKLDCAYDDAGEDPIRLLFDGDGQRGRTAVLGLACTAGPDKNTTLYMNNVDLCCYQDGEKVLFPIDPTMGPGNLGGLAGSGVPNDLVFEAAVYEGFEQLTASGADLSKRYWNVAIGLNTPESTGLTALGASGALTNCTVYARATAHDGPMKDGITPDGAYPYLFWNDIPLNAQGDLTCTRHGLGDGVETRYTDTALPMSFTNVLTPVEDAGDVVGVTTDAIVIDDDDDWTEARALGTVGPGLDIHAGGRVGAELPPSSGHDTVDWFTFAKVTAPSDTLLCLYPVFGAEHIDLDTFYFRLYAESDLITPVAVRNANDPNLELSLPPGIYYVEVIATDGTVPPGSEVFYYLGIFLL